MLDRDLAELYDVTTGNLNKAVGRNIKRFPKDFMFELTAEEFNNLKSNFNTKSWGGIRKMPKVFTEQGVAMLSNASTLTQNKCSITIFKKLFRRKNKEI